MREAGEGIAIEIDGVTYSRKAVVQNAGKNFMRKYDDEFNNKRDLGNKLRRDKIAFIPYFKAWDEYEGVITVGYRKRLYIVTADSVMRFGNEPVYIWALLREKTACKEGYYDSTIG